MGLNHDSVDRLLATLEGEEDVGARPRSLTDLEPLREELERAAGPARRANEPRRLARGEDNCLEAFEAAREIALLVNRAHDRYGARGCPIDGSAGGELTTNEYSAMGLAARRLVTALRRVAL